MQKSCTHFFYWLKPLILKGLFVLALFLHNSKWEDTNQRGGRIVKKFLTMYAVLFTAIWVGYGIYALWTNQESAHLILGLGVAFSIVICLASWFSYWLMRHYKRVDSMAKNILSNSKNKTK